VFERFLSWFGGGGWAMPGLSGFGLSVIPVCENNELPALSGMDDMLVFGV
jgi:hypothetical protein